MHRRALLVALAVVSTIGCAALAGLGNDYASASSDSGDGDGGAGEGAPSTPIAASCKALLAASPSAAGHNGLYDIDPDGPDGNPPLHVFCEMSLAGGGWTLVGRSALGGPAIGWGTNAGSVLDLTLPYSIDVRGAGLAFIEILLTGADGVSLDASTRAYRLSIETGFLTDHTDDTVHTVFLETIFGDCAPEGGPEMLRYAGATTRTDSFFFRDIPDPSEHDGLKADGFSTTYANCKQGGSLNQTPGLIFVR